MSVIASSQLYFMAAVEASGLFRLDSLDVFDANQVADCCFRKRFRIVFSDIVFNTFPFGYSRRVWMGHIPDSVM